jgi:hypothetical protein
MVTAAAPDEVSVTVFVADVFSATFPKAKLAALSVSPGVVAPSCRSKLTLTLPACAISVAVCAAVTALTVAANPAVVAPSGTVTDAGTTTAALLLDRLTACPPLPAGDASSTKHWSVPAPVIVPLLHAITLNRPDTTSPVPLSAIAALSDAAFVVSATAPVVAPLVGGSN